MLKQKKNKIEANFPFSCSKSQCWAKIKQKFQWSTHLLTSCSLNISKLKWLSSFKKKKTERICFVTFFFYVFFFNRNFPSGILSSERVYVSGKLLLLKGKLVCTNVNGRRLNFVPASKLLKSAFFNFLYNRGGGSEHARHKGFSLKTRFQKRTSYFRWKTKNTKQIVSMTAL